MKIAKRICDVIFNILKYVVAILMIIMVVLTFIEVIRRYFFGQNWIWSEVLVRYMIVWCTFLGGAAAYRVGQLTKFDLVLNKFNDTVKLILGIVCDLLLLAFAAWLISKGVETFLKPSIANQISVELGISVRWIYLAIPVGFGCMCLFGIERIINEIAELVNLKKTKAAKEVSGK